MFIILLYFYPSQRTYTLPHISDIITPHRCQTGMFPQIHRYYLLLHLQIRKQLLQKWVLWILIKSHRYSSILQPLQIGWYLMRLYKSCILERYIIFLADNKQPKQNHIQYFIDMICISGHHVEIHQLLHWTHHNLIGTLNYSIIRLLIGDLQFQLLHQLGHLMPQNVVDPLRYVSLN